MIYAYNHVLLMFMMFHDVWKNSGLIEESYSKLELKKTGFFDVFTVMYRYIQLMHRFIKLMYRYMRPMHRCMLGRMRKMRKIQLCIDS